MMFVHCSKSANMIGQNRSHVFWLTITHEKCGIIEMAAGSGVPK